MHFEWDPRKNVENEVKHGVSFLEAQTAFADPKRVIRIDHKHSTKKEKRYFCFGKVYDEVLTVRFCVRRNAIRIFGAGFWREGKRFYEKKDTIQQRSQGRGGSAG